MTMSDDSASEAIIGAVPDQSLSNSNASKSPVEPRDKRKSLAAFFAAIKFRSNNSANADIDSRSKEGSRDGSGLNRGFARLKSCARKATDFPSDDDGWVRSAN